MQRLADQFFASVRQRLAPGGVVAANVAYRDMSPVYDLIVGRMTVKLGISEIDLVPGESQNRIVFIYGIVKP